MRNDRSRPKPERSWPRPAAGAIPPNLAGSGLLNLEVSDSNPPPGEQLVWLSQLLSSEAGTRSPYKKYPLGLTLVSTAALAWGRTKRVRTRAVGCAPTSLPGRSPTVRLTGRRRFSARQDEPVDPPSAGPRPGGSLEVGPPSHLSLEFAV
jgi:hypothetical protein